MILICHMTIQISVIYCNVHCIDKSSPRTYLFNVADPSFQRLLFCSSILFVIHQCCLLTSNLSTVPLSSLYTCNIVFLIISSRCIVIIIIIVIMIIIIIYFVECVSNIGYILSVVLYTLCRTVYPIPS